MTPHARPASADADRSRRSGREAALDVAPLRGVGRGCCCAQINKLRWPASVSNLHASCAAQYGQSTRRACPLAVAFYVTRARGRRTVALAAWRTDRASLRTRRRWRAVRRGDQKKAGRGPPPAAGTGLRPRGISRSNSKRPRAGPRATPSAARPARRGRRRWRLSQRRRRRVGRRCLRDARAEAGMRAWAARRPRRGPMPASPAAGGEQGDSWRRFCRVATTCLRP